MAKVNALNALMFGSEDDAIYLGPLGTDLSTVTGLTTQLPDGLVDCGWVGEDGFELALDDSTGVIRGHQGGGVVKSFMESSETRIIATLLETQLKTFEWFLDTKGKKGTDSGLKGSKKDIGTFSIPSARRVIDLCGVIDLYDTSNPETRVRLVCKHLSLGARESVSFKIGEITAYKTPLQVIGGLEIITNHPALIPSS